MAARNLNKDQPEAVRMVFQRLCEGEDVVQVQFGELQGEFKVLAETPDRIILGISDLERGQWRLKPGARLTLKVLDRGLLFEAVVDFQGHGRLHGVEACHVTLPRLLRAVDAHRLADFVPDRPIPCSFSDQRNDIQDGKATAFGEDGLELAPPPGTKVLGDMLRLNAASTVEVKPPAGEGIVLAVKVAYFGEKTWGLRLADSADRMAVSRYRQWMLEARHAQANRDRSRFNPGGLESSRLTVRKEASKPATAQLRILVDRDPQALLEDLLERLEREGRVDLDAFRRDLNAELACRAAIKKHHALPPELALGLVQDLLACEVPNTCPHGRPIIKKLTLDDLERSFGRRV